MLGLLCIAFTKKSASALAKAFSLRKTTKIYLALVYGKVEPLSYKDQNQGITLESYNDNSENKMTSIRVKTFLVEKGIQKKKEIEISFRKTK